MFNTLRGLGTLKTSGSWCWIWQWTAACPLTWHTAGCSPGSCMLDLLCCQTKFGVLENMKAAIDFFFVRRDNWSQWSTFRKPGTHQQILLQRRLADQDNSRLSELNELMSEDTWRRTWNSLSSEHGAPKKSAKLLAAARLS